MKQALRSFLVIAIALAAGATGSVAYFTSSVQATGNLIQTGTLRLAVDSTAFGVGNSGYVVAEDNGSGTVLYTTVPTITNMQPGETRSVYISLRNSGTLPLDYRANIQGTWGDGGLDGQHVMQVSNVRRYAVNNCSGNGECEDIYYWLTGGPWINSAPATDTDFAALGTAYNSGYFGHADAVSDGLSTLGANQFAIFKVDFTMSTAAGNAFQGETFTYTVNGQAKQTTAPTF